MANKVFEVTLKYFLEVLKPSQSYQLKQEVEKIVNGGEISSEDFGQICAVDVKANLSFERRDESWRIKIVEKKTNRELCIENKNTGQYSYNGKEEIK